YKISPDAVLGFSEVFNPMTIFCARILGYRIIISDRSSPHRERALQTRVLQRLIYPLADGMIAQTQASKKNERAKNYKKKIIVIPNPLREINDFYNKTYPKVVISMGRLIPSKNFIELIQIFDDSDCNKEWSLVILGEGPERENIENEIRRLSLEDRVELVGAVSDV